MSSNSSNVTFTIDSSNPTASPWYVAANDTDSNSTSKISGNPMFYIVTTSNSFEQAGFATNSSAVPTGGATTGFTWFGKAIAMVTDNEYQSSFWAVNTSVSGLWSLYWGTNVTGSDDVFPVVLKNTAPVTY